MPVFTRALPEGNLDLYYECSGAPGLPPLVLLPGWTLNLHLWDPQVAELERSFRLIRMDPRNTGSSTSDPALPSTRLADAQDLAALLDHLGVPKAHVVGHSKGARNLAHFALLWPHRLLSVTFVGTAEPHPPPGHPLDYRDAAHIGVDLVRDLARGEGVEAALAKLRRGRLIGKLHATPEGMHTLHRAMEGYRCADLLGATPPRHLDLTPLPELLSVPVHIVCGEDDPFLGECRYAAGMYRDAALTVLPKCGHMPMLESPGAFLVALWEFFAVRCGVPHLSKESSVVRNYAPLETVAAPLAPISDPRERMRLLTDILWDHLGPTGVSWCGFYIPGEVEGEMVLLSCKPKPACSPIGMHGACGQSFLAAKTLVVHDVRELGPNYVACDPRDQSEVVVPVTAHDGSCLGVLDLDSHDVGSFTEADAQGLLAVLRAAGLAK